VIPPFETNGILTQAATCMMENRRREGGKKGGRGRHQSPLSVPWTGKAPKKLEKWTSKRKNKGGRENRKRRAQAFTSGRKNLSGSHKRGEKYKPNISKKNVKVANEERLGSNPRAKEEDKVALRIKTSEKKAVRHGLGWEEA